MRRKIVRSNPRNALIRLFLDGYVRRGYRVIWLGSDAAVLSRRKRFSLLWFFVLGAPYVIWYLLQGDERLRVTLWPNGDLSEVRL